MDRSYSSRPQRAKTAMVEQFGFAGGMATAGLVLPISVFTYNDKLVCGGIPWEFVRRMETVGGAQVEKPLGNVAHDPEVYKLTAQRCCWKPEWSCITIALSPVAVTKTAI